MVVSPATDTTAAVERRSRIQTAVVWILALVITALSLTAHLAFDSSMHESESMWQRKVAVHRTAYAFKVRPLTTSIVVALHDHAGVPERTGFMVLQFALYLLCGPAFWLFLRTIGFSHSYSLAGMVVYLLALPLFMAHFAPVHTWSDFWVYLLVPLSFILVIKRQYPLAVIAMVAALMARETTFLFLPPWFLLIYVDRHRKLLLATGLTVLTAGLFVVLRLWLSGRILVPPEVGPEFNFETFLRGSDSIFSLAVSLGFVWVVGLWQAFRKSSHPVKYSDVIRFGAVLTAAGFVASTILMARARETRLFAPPAILLIPLVLVWLRDRASSIKELVRRIPLWAISVLGTALVAGGIYATYLAFPKFEYRTWPEGNRVYLGIHLALTATFMILELYSLRRAGPDKIPGY